VTNVSGFAHGPSRPDPVNANNDSECQKHFDATDVTFVDDLFNATGRVEAIGTLKILLDWHAANENTIAHEIGHGVGLYHGSHTSEQTMYGTFSATKDELTYDDTDAFDQ
jgi:hypothetical protein